MALIQSILGSLAKKCNLLVYRSVLSKAGLLISKEAVRFKKPIESFCHDSLDSFPHHASQEDRSIALHVFGYLSFLWIILTMALFHCEGTLPVLQIILNKFNRVFNAHVPRCCKNSE